MSRKFRVFEENLQYILLLKNFIVMDLLAPKVTGYEVKRKLIYNFPFGVMSGSFNSQT